MANNCSSTFPAKKRKPMIKRSWVWRYFKDIQQRKVAACLMCDQELEYSGPTTNMAYHLSRIHQIERATHRFETDSNGILSEGDSSDDNESDGLTIIPKKKKARLDKKLVEFIIGNNTC